MTDRAPSSAEGRRAREGESSRPGQDTPQAPPLRDRFDHAGAAGAVLIASGFVVLVFVVLGLWLWHDRTRTLADGERVTSNLAKLLEEQTNRTFQAVDLTLVGMIDALHLAPHLGEHDPEFEQALRRRRDELPYVRALFVIGPDGFITQDTDPDTPPVSLADRGYFIAHEENPDLGLYVGPPLVSRSVGVWFVSMSRRIERPDGSFGGIVVAAVEPRYFESFYDALALGEGNVITLFNKSGVLIARNPPREEAVGRPFADLELFRRRLKESRHGTYRSASAIDGVRRIFSYRALDDFPFVVVVGLAEEELLAEWRANAVAGVATAALIAVLTIALTIVVVRQQRQRELARARMAQMQKLEALGHLTGSIVHDFKNLLMAVSAGTNLIRSHSADGEIRKITDMIADAVARGNRLIGQLLSFARRQELAVEAMDLNALLSEIETLLKHAAGPDVKLALKLDPALWRCLADRSQFDSAMLNLVVNAKDAMPAGGEVRIGTANWRQAVGPATSALQAGDYVLVTVADNGNGMTPEVLQRALDPFFTTKKDGGTGLGLSQVFGVVRQIGGDLRIESRVGIGTTVHLFFPRAPGPEDQPS